MADISNGSINVRFENGGFTVTDRKSGKIFIKQGLLGSISTSCRQEEAKDPVFGNGRRIVINRKHNAGEISLELFDDLPFLLVRGTIHNVYAQELDLREHISASFTLDLGTPVNELMTVGTGGLLAPDKNPGSYLFLTCADPASRNGVVAGWLTQDRGCGIIFSSVNDDAVEFKAQTDYGHLRIPVGGTATLETLVIGYFDDARIGEELYADAVKMQYDIKLRKPDAVYCTWYCDGKDHGGAGTEATTKELSKFIAKELKQFGLSVIQIDDWWQDGPKVDGPARGFERANPNGPYPNGMEPVARELEKDGITMGIWWLPFGRNHEVDEYKGRQHWFAKWSDGTVMRTKGFGGTCLDLTHPEVRTHVANIARLYRDWGIKYYKMDGLWTGTATEQVYINDGYRCDNMQFVAPLHDPLKTQIEAYRDGLKVLRENAGDDVFFSGCCISQNMRSITAIGLVDSMRIGPDFNHDGQGIKTGPLRGSRLYFMNGRIWWNDPDPTKVRTSAEPCDADGSCNGAVSLEQARLTTSWVSLSGMFFLISDWLPDLPPERMEILKRTLAHHEAISRPVDYFDRDLPAIWLVTDTKQSVRRDVIGIFNFEKEPMTIKTTWAKLGLESSKKYHAFDFWANKLLPGFAGEFSASADPNSCRVIAVRADEGHPLILSTSRHVSQGIIDMEDETWSGNTLSAKSSVIANDPYELRIAGITDGGKTWRAENIELSAEDNTAGVTASLKQDGPSLIRATISSPLTRQVKWNIRFKCN